MIKCADLSISFENKNILKNVTLEVQNHLSILGANGSGKSSFAKALSGLIEFEGDIAIESQNIKTLTPNARAKLLSYIPTKLELYDKLITVEEFVLLGRFPYKESFFSYEKKDYTIVKEMLEFLSIAHLAKHTIAELSSGEQQLTLIAQALTQQSKIIIFDEPTANLDPKNSKIIAQHIKALKKEHTIILITHDLHLAAFIDSQMLFIKDKSAKLYEKEFFSDTMLEELYGVAFSNLAVRYD